MLGGGTILLAGMTAWGQLPGGPAGGEPATEADDPSYLPQMLMVAGIVVIALTITRLARRRVTATTHDDHRDPPRERLEAIKAGADARAARQHSEGIMDPVTAATELAVMLDNRAVRVEQLIRDADDRLARLAESGESTEPEPEPESQPASGPGDGASPDAEPAKDDEELRHRANDIHQRAAAGRDPSAISRELDIPLDEVRRVLATEPPSPPTGDSP